MPICTLESGLEEGAVAATVLAALAPVALVLFDDCVEQAHSATAMARAIVNVCSRRISLLLAFLPVRFRPNPPDAPSFVTGHEFAHAGSAN
jgi:hypothetical protein